MKVLLIHPKSPNIAKSQLIWPPLGLCRIATYLRNLGHTVSIVEDGLNYYNIESFSFPSVDVVGIGAMTIQANRAWQWIKAISNLKPRPRIIVGGPHFPALLEQGEILFDIDAVAVGDGEQVMIDFLSGKTGILRGEPVEYVPIDFDCIDYKKYGDHLVDGRRAISILTSRGCYGKCKFCGSPKLFGGKVLFYPINQVVDNMECLSSRHSIANFRIMDDNFTCNFSQLKEFCSRVKSCGFKMACLAVVNSLNVKKAELMVKAGFEWVAIGVESSDENILKISNKSIKPSKVKETVGYLKKLGLKIEALFMIGLPGETKESLEKTIDFAAELGADRIHSQYFTPFPGSKFYEEILCGEHGLMVSKNWNDYDHRYPVFLSYSISMQDLLEGGRRFFDLCGRGD